jgi:hypothetical protein
MSLAGVDLTTNGASSPDNIALPKPVAHKPSPRKRKLALDHIAAHSKDKKAAYENILWALITTKELLFNQ